MLFAIPVESIVQKLGGVILYEPNKNKIIKQYVHDKTWGGQRVGWRGGKLHDGIMIATDWTDLHFFDVKNWKYIKTFKKRTFNDLHYVEVFNDQLYVVNTGLDAIEIFTNPFDPVHAQTIYMFDRFPKLFKKRKIDPNTNYNDMFKIRPHMAHPNCIASNGKYMFVTCFQKRPTSETGEIVDIQGGGKLNTNHISCHDGNFYKNAFYASHTRKAKLIIYYNINDRKLPIKRPDKTYHFGAKGWWRGMVLTKGKAYTFASLYTKKKRTARVSIINLKDGTHQLRPLPVKDNVFWDTVYQPNLYEV